jgi:phage-related protein
MADMATFPKLKTNAIAQYPVGRREQFRNETVRFVDGSEQRYRDSGSTRLEWDIQLSQLDEGELAAIEEFFLASQGAFGSFSFTDPSDGTVYDNCSVGADTLTLLTVGEMRGSTKLTVVRNI